MTYQRKEVIGDATLYLADAADVLDLLPAGEGTALVFDPPYGLKGGARHGNHAYDATRPRSGWHGAPNASGTENLTRRVNVPLPPDLMQTLLNRHEHAVVWGGNCYPLPPSSAWLAWDKRRSGTGSKLELAWTSLRFDSVRVFEYLWNGYQKAAPEDRHGHPTYKPVSLMHWCLDQLPAGVHTVTDPTMGCGSTGVAAVERRLRFVGVEVDPRWFETACRRIEDAYRRPEYQPPSPALFSTSTGEAAA